MSILIIMAKTDGHMVSSILENITQGGAKGVYKALHEFFYNDSQAGKGAAIKSFHTATMGSTDLNVVEYTAQISRLAKIVRESGGQADGGAQLSVLLDGLLPEFHFIKRTLNALDGLTLDVARSKILHFATTQVWSSPPRGVPSLCLHSASLRFISELARACSDLRAEIKDDSNTSTRGRKHLEYIWRSNSL
jgi:hypothetical protein